MLDFLMITVSFALAAAFAAVWGAHLFDTVVLVPVWAVEPPKSVLDFIAAPYAKRVGGLFRALFPALGVVALIAVIVAIMAGLATHPALAIASVCGLLHVAMIFLFFIPTNQRLGFIPGGPGATSFDPQEIGTLVARWRQWNLARLGVDTAGLVAALIALKAS